MNGSMISTKINALYSTLLDLYGEQGWWPLLKHSGTNPTKTGSITGYHCGDYSFPRTEDEQFEISLGAILTQNTTWVCAEKALNNLLQCELVHSPQKIIHSSEDIIKKAIRPAGYFNQKTNYIIAMAEFFLTKPTAPSRKELLALRGVGEETADAILLYAFSQPSFVIDAYTRRAPQFHEIISGNESYKAVQDLFHKSLPADISLFQEYHALFVEHGKRHFSKKPFGDSIQLT